MLVWDRNGNGLIDCGAELSGDETTLANGQKAPHSFAALSDLGTGSVVNGVAVGASDGVLDAKDAQEAGWMDMAVKASDAGLDSYKAMPVMR